MLVPAGLTSAYRNSLSAALSTLSLPIRQLLSIGRWSSNRNEEMAGSVAVKSARRSPSSHMRVQRFIHSSPYQVAQTLSSSPFCHPFLRFR
jgi:hypothetical protein